MQDVFFRLRILRGVHSLQTASQDIAIAPDSMASMPSYSLVQLPSEGATKRPLSYILTENVVNNTDLPPLSKRRAAAAHLSVVAALSTILIPLVALFAWITRRHLDGASFASMFNTFAGEKIGGRLTQSQAKAIDILTGAVLVPLVVTGFNVVIFGSARISVVNEQAKKAIPLRSLVAVSSTSSGSYDIIR